MKIVINGTEYHPRKLTVHDISVLQDEYKESLMDDASTFASRLTGKERREFLADTWKGLPSGEALAEGTAAWLQSVTGIIKIIELVCGEDVQIGDLSDVEAYLPIIEYVFGHVNKEEVKEDGEKAPLPFPATEEKKIEKAEQQD